MSAIDPCSKRIVDKLLNGYRLSPDDIAIVAKLTGLRRGSPGAPRKSDRGMCRLTDEMLKSPEGRKRIIAMITGNSVSEIETPRKRIGRPKGSTDCNVKERKRLAAKQYLAKAHSGDSTPMEIYQNLADNRSVLHAKLRRDEVNGYESALKMSIRDVAEGMDFIEASDLQPLVIADISASLRSLLRTHTEK